VDLAAHRLTVDNRIIETTAREFELLKYFVTHEDAVLTRLQILKNVWGIDQTVTERTVDNFVARLRQKIERDPESPCYLQTVRGVGYRFISGV
jgi:DNA-binding response OmpR family regulator